MPEEGLKFENGKTCEARRYTRIRKRSALSLLSQELPQQIEAIAKADVMLVNGNLPWSLL
jgi:hypothetical protein